MHTMCILAALFPITENWALAESRIPLKQLAIILATSNLRKIMGSLFLEGIVFKVI